MKAWLFALLIAGVPVTAQALSCMPYSVEAAYLEAQADEARFVIVRGHLDFDAAQLPEVDHSNQSATPELTEIEARLTGTSLSGAGFTTPFSKPVTLAVACYGPWCATVPQGSEVLAFVELGAQGDTITTNPCGGYLFATPTPRMIRAVKACFGGEACVPLR